MEFISSEYWIPNDDVYTEDSLHGIFANPKNTISKCKLISILLRSKFHYNTIVPEVKDCLVSLDQKASSFSLLSILTNNKVLGQKCSLIQLRSHTNESDLYVTILQDILSTVGCPSKDSNRH